MLGDAVERETPRVVEGMPDRCRDAFAGQPFDSGNGLMTYVWGPPLWLSLHMITFNYPTSPDERAARHFRRFFRLLRHVLPCGACRSNLKRNLRLHPLTDADLASRDALSRWLHGLHARVNGSLGKPPGESYETLRGFCEHFRARCAPGEGGCRLSQHAVAARAWTKICILPQEGRGSSEQSVCMHESCVLSSRAEAP